MRALLLGALLAALAVPALADDSPAAGPAPTLEEDLRTVASLTAEGKHGEAFDLAVRLVGENPASVEAHIAYQDLRLAAGGDRDLVKRYAAAAGAPEATADQVYLHARLLQGSRGITMLKKVLRLAPNHFHALCDLGSRYTEVGKYRDAEKCLSLAVRMNRKSAVPCSCLGWLEECRGDPEKAEERYRDAIKREPGHAVSHLNLGVLLVNTGRLEDAEAVLETARKLAPGSPMPLLARGLLLTAKEEPEGARELFEKAVKMETNTLTSLNLLASTYIELEELGLAKQALQRALALAEDHVLTLVNLTILCLRENQPDQANRWVRRAIHEDSKCAEAFYFLGLCLGDMGKNKAAEGSFVRASKLDPENAVFWRALGNHYTRLGKWREAVRTLSRAIDLDGETPELLMDLAFAYSGAGDARRAAANFEAALEIDPDLLKAWLTLGLLYQEKLRKPQKAIEAFEEFLDRGGKDDRVQVWLDLLKAR